MTTSWHSHPRLPRHGDVRPAAPADRRALHQAGGRRLGRGERRPGARRTCRRRAPSMFARLVSAPNRLGGSRVANRQPGRVARRRPAISRRGASRRAADFSVAAVPVSRAAAARRHRPRSSAEGARRARSGHGPPPWPGAPCSRRTEQHADNDHGPRGGGCGPGALTIVDATQATRLAAACRTTVSMPPSARPRNGCAARRAQPSWWHRLGVLREIITHSASWFAAEEMHAGYYGTPLRLASMPDECDMSTTVVLVDGCSVVPDRASRARDGRHRPHDIGLADGLRGELRIGPTGSAIVSIGGDDLESALAAHGIKAATAPSAALSRSTSTTTKTTFAAAAAALRDGARKLSVAWRLGRSPGPAHLPSPERCPAGGPARCNDARWGGLVVGVTTALGIRVTTDAEVGQSGGTV